MSAKFRFLNETPALVRVVKEATIKSIGHAAGYIRKVAKNSIKRKKGSSDPGAPPHTHTGALRHGIEYAVENQNQTAVIGPTRSSVGQIAHTHEFGGTEPPKGKTLRRGAFVFEIGGVGPITVKGGKLILIRYKTAQEVEAGRALMSDPRTPRDARFPASGKPRHYAPRPFMGPALVKSRRVIPSFWANSIKGG